MAPHFPLSAQDIETILRERLNRPLDELHEEMRKRSPLLADIVDDADMQSRTMAVHMYHLISSANIPFITEREAWRRYLDDVKSSPIQEIIDKVSIGEITREEAARKLAYIDDKRTHIEEMEKEYRNMERDDPVLAAYLKRHADERGALPWVLYSTAITIYALLRKQSEIKGGRRM
jgi:hypothetical protein